MTEGLAPCLPVPRAAAIVLAAGASSRLGQPKQLIEIEAEAGRESLLRRAVRMAIQAGCSPVIVVLGSCDQPCRNALNGLAGVHLVHNADWREGMGSSLRVGISALQGSLLIEGAGGETAPSALALKTPSAFLQLQVEPVDSVLVMVTDQVRVTEASLARLFAAHHAGTGPATAAFYGKRLGVPAIFRRELFPALLALRGDKGARFLLGQLGDRAAGIPMPEAAFDLDTPADLDSLGCKG